MIIKIKILQYGLICSLILLFTQCIYRTSSPERFSKVLDIEIPTEVEIIKDEYQDMMQDFVIIYEIKLSKGEMSKLSKSIRESKYYNHKAVVEDFVSQEMFIEYDDMKAVWAKTNSGYVFQNNFNRDAYSAKVDTVSMTVEFNESHD